MGFFFLIELNGWMDGVGGFLNGIDLNEWDVSLRPFLLIGSGDSINQVVEIRCLLGMRLVFFGSLLMWYGVLLSRRIVIIPRDRSMDLWR